MVVRFVEEVHLFDFFIGHGREVIESAIEHFTMAARTEIQTVAGECENVKTMPSVVAACLSENPLFSLAYLHAFPLLI